MHCSDLHAKKETLMTEQSGLKDKNSESSSNSYSSGFTESSHYNYWLFPNQNGINQKMMIQITQCHSQIMNDNNKNNKNNHKIKSININEYHLIIIEYCQLILQICQDFKLPIHLWYTAITYFKRYLLWQSLIAIDPKILAVTCIFLACKAEQCIVKCEILAKYNRIHDKKLISQSEIHVLNALKFHLFVWKPFRAFNCLLADCQKVMKSLQRNVPNKEILTKTMHANMKFVLLSDIILIYTPSQIALALLLYTLQSLKSEVGQPYFEHRFGKNASFQKLQSTIQEIMKRMTDTQNTDFQHYENERKYAKSKLEIMQQCYQSMISQNANPALPTKKRNFDNMNTN